MPASSTPIEKVYQIKIILKDSEPSIWRRVKIASSIDLLELHGIIQAAMGWKDCHMHQFVSGGRHFGDEDPDFDYKMTDERTVRVDELLKKEKGSITYEYDFDDSWEHMIRLEKILPGDDTPNLPVCVEGERACPPEEIGGVWGYEDMLDSLKNTRDRDHKKAMAIFGKDYDPDRLDIEEINARLAGLKKNQ